MAAVRIGENPAKSETTARSDASIRVVVPVYIPDLTGYFADAGAILGLCLDDRAPRGLIEFFTQALTRSRD